MSKPLIVPVFIPHFGCPHTCVFCNQKKIAGDYQLPSGQLLEDMVQAYRMSSSSKTREVQLAFYGGSFTGLEEAQQRQLLSAAAELKARGLIDKIRLSTRPDYIDEERLTLLTGYQADIIELGVQSMDEAVLKASQRGHTAEDVLRAVEWIRSYPQFALGLQMMVALPADTPAKSLATAKKIAALAPDFVRHLSHSHHQGYRFGTGLAAGRLRTVADGAHLGYDGKHLGYFLPSPYPRHPHRTAGNR